VSQRQVQSTAFLELRYTLSFDGRPQQREISLDLDHPGTFQDHRHNCFSDPWSLPDCSVCKQRIEPWQFSLNGSVLRFQTFSKFSNIVFCISSAANIPCAVMGQPWITRRAFFYEITRSDSVMVFTKTQTQQLLWLGAAQARGKCQLLSYLATSLNLSSLE
jgi:hypothetical protein